MTGTALSVSARAVKSRIGEEDLSWEEEDLSWEEEVLSGEEEVWS